ncbi:MAG: hypothetical protein AAGB18_07055, partial [Pseudomonadota bacterium]
MSSSTIDRLKRLAALALALLALPLAAQIVPGAEEEAEVPAAPAPDPLGRETPRGAVDGLLSALSLQDYERAGEYLSPPLAETPEEPASGEAQSE